MPGSEHVDKRETQQDMYPLTDALRAVSFDGIKANGKITSYKEDASTATLSGALAKALEGQNDIKKLIPAILARAVDAGFNVSYMLAGDKFEIKNSKLYFTKAKGKNILPILLHDNPETLEKGKYLQRKKEVIADTTQKTHDVRDAWENIEELFKPRILDDIMWKYLKERSPKGREDLWNEMRAKGQDYTDSMMTWGANDLKEKLSSDKNFLKGKYREDVVHIQALVEYMRTYGLDELVKTTGDDKKPAAAPAPEAPTAATEPPKRKKREPIRVEEMVVTGTREKPAEPPKQPAAAEPTYEEKVAEEEMFKMFQELLDRATKEVGHDITASVQPVKEVGPFVPLQSPDGRYAGPGEDTHGFFVAVEIPRSEVMNMNPRPPMDGEHVEIKDGYMITDPKKAEENEVRQRQKHFLLIFEKADFGEIRDSLRQLVKYAESPNRTYENAPKNMYQIATTNMLENVVGSEFIKNKTSEIGTITQSYSERKPDLPIYKIDVADGDKHYDAYVYARGGAFLIGTPIGGHYETIESAFMNNPDEIKAFIIEKNRASPKPAVSLTPAPAEPNPVREASPEAPAAATGPDEKPATKNTELMAFDHQLQDGFLIDIRQLKEKSSDGATAMVQCHKQKTTADEPNNGFVTILLKVTSGGYVVTDGYDYETQEGKTPPSFSSAKDVADFMVKCSKEKQSKSEAEKKAAPETPVQPATSVAPVEQANENVLTVENLAKKFKTADGKIPEIHDFNGEKYITVDLPIDGKKTKSITIYLAPGQGYWYRQPLMIPDFATKPDEIVNIAGLDIQLFKEKYDLTVSELTKLGDSFVPPAKLAGIVETADADNGKFVATYKEAGSSDKYKVTVQFPDRNKNEDNYVIRLVKVGAPEGTPSFETHTFENLSVAVANENADFKKEKDIAKGIFESAIGPTNRHPSLGGASVYFVRLKDADQVRAEIELRQGGYIVQVYKPRGLKSEPTFIPGDINKPEDVIEIKRFIVGVYNDQDNNGKTDKTPGEVKFSEADIGKFKKNLLLNITGADKIKFKNEVKDVAEKDQSRYLEVQSEDGSQILRVHLGISKGTYRAYIYTKGGLESDTPYKKFEDSDIKNLPQRIAGELGL